MSSSTASKDCFCRSESIQRFDPECLADELPIPDLIGIAAAGGRKATNPRIGLAAQVAHLSNEFRFDLAAAEKILRRGSFAPHTEIVATATRSAPKI